MAYLYLISKIDNNEDIYKIGFTRKNPKLLKRLKQLQTGNENDLILVDQYESKFAIMIETAIHNMWKHKNKRGEWFYLTQEEVLNFKNKCKKIEENFIFLSKENEYFKKNYKIYE